MTHTLTDEQIVALIGGSNLVYCLNEDQMRLVAGAADRQLEQVLNFMREHEQLFGGSGMIFILEDAMRPQQQENQ